MELHEPIYVDQEQDVIPTVTPIPTMRRKQPRKREVEPNAIGFFGLLGRGLEWLFGAFALLVGLAFLSAIPVLQILSLGYLLEVSGRVARTGRLGAGFVGVRKAARVGTIVLGGWLLLLPLRLTADYAYSAAILDPGGRTAILVRIGHFVLMAVLVLHLIFAILRGGRFRDFLNPFNAIFVLLDLAAGRFYTRKRDAVWDFVVGLRLPYYAMLGGRGFLGTMLWLLLPTTLLAVSRAPVPGAPAFGVLGGLLLIPVLVYLPFLQTRFAASGKWSDLFGVMETREEYRHAPWAFAFAFVVSLLFALPLYVLKIETVPQEAEWLPGLVFLLFIAPARLLAGWSLGRARKRMDNERGPRHWFFRWTGRTVFIPIAAFYVLILSFTPYTSWNGLWSLYEQHAFLVPVPYLSL